MVFVEFQYSHRKKKVIIEGQVDQKTLSTINLLHQICERFYLDKFIDFFIKHLNYQNQQFGSVLLVLLITIGTEIISHFYFNSSSQQAYSHLISAGLITYTFLFQIIIKKQIKIYVLVLLQIIWGIQFTVIKSYSIEDYNFSIYFLILNSTCMVLTIVKIVLEEQLKSKMFSIFQFESNLLIAVYLVGKFMQFILSYIRGQYFDSWNLIRFVVCLIVLNSLKIWHLFDFNTIFLLQTLSQINNQDKLDAKNKQYVEEVLSMINSNGFLKSITQKTDISKNIKGQSKQNQMDSIKQSNQILQESNQSSDQTYGQQTNEILKVNPYNKYIWMAFTTNILFGGMIICFIVFSTFSYSKIILMSLGLVKSLIIMLYCEYEFIMLGQVQKHKFVYLQQFLADLLVSCPLVLAALFFNTVNSSTIFEDKFSLFMNVSLPFISILLYRACFQKMMQNKQNSSMLHFYFCWIQLFGLRQTLKILISGYISPIGYIIDACLIIYTIIILVAYSKVNYYKKLYNQVQKIKTIKKHNLYIMQNIRNWKYNPINLNQIFYFINIYTLFVGYYQIKSGSSVLKTQEISYLIVFFSCILIHLLNIYNTYYYETWIQKQEKPIYSPYYNCIIMILGSVGYLIYQYLIDSNNQSGKTWSFICLVITLFTVLNNIMGNYAFQTINIFRNAFKTFNIVYGYFMFYYPYITIFTIYFFYNNYALSSIFYYSVFGFAYLTITSIITGIFVHFILNLTQKSKKSLFLVKQLAQEFKKINMKQDSDFVSMMENLYDLMDGNSENLLVQLKKQKMSRIILHDDQEIQHDYSFGQPIVQQKQKELVKVFNQNMDRVDRRNSSRKQIKIVTIKNIQFKKPQTKSNFYIKNNLQDANSKLNEKSKFYKKSSDIVNQNHVQIKRLIEQISKYSVNSSQLQIFKRKMEQSPQFGQIIQKETLRDQILHRFYHFLSSPSQQITFQTFSLLNTLLMKKSNKNLLQIFNKYSENAVSLNEQSFRNFLASYIIQHYKIRPQNQNPKTVWKQFLINQLFFYIQKGNDAFKYYMKRKNISINQETHKIWNSIKNQQAQKQLFQFKQKYNLKRYKALIKKSRDNKSQSIQINLNSGQNNDINIQPQTIQLQNKEKQNQIKKKHILFMSPQRIYTQLVQCLVQSIQKYQKIEHQNFKLQSIKFSGANVIAILTKIFDFGYLYMYGSIYSLYAYGSQNFDNGKWTFSFINYNYLFGSAFLCVITYVGLIVYHKKQFTKGSLGLDQNQKPLSLTNFKFYTQFLLFLMGSPLSNLFILASLNSYLCDQSSSTLWNFPSNTCYSTIHLFQMFFSLLILLSYYPLASLIFPFSTAIDRTLQIKYKAQYEIIYLQCKFLINGINILFNQMSFQSQQLIKSISKTIVCLVLLIFFHKMQPCSVDFINSIQLKIYFGLVIINAASILCYFVGFKITVISFGVLLFLYIIYSILSSFSLFNNPTDKNNQGNHTLVDERFRKQNTIKKRLEIKDQIQESSGYSLSKKEDNDLDEDLNQNENDKNANYLKKFQKIQNKDQSVLNKGSNVKGYLNRLRQSKLMASKQKENGYHDNSQYQKQNMALKRQIALINNLNQRQKSFSVEVVKDTTDYVSAQKNIKGKKISFEPNFKKKSMNVKFKNQD